MGGFEHDGAKQAAVGQELAAHHNTELVAFRVREHDVVGSVTLPDIDVFGAERK